jgi:hypothetical protein
LLRYHPDAVEADLQIRCNGVDYRDRWRFGANGRRLLTIRRIGVLLRGLPPDSETARAEGSSGFTNTEFLLMDLWQMQTSTGEPHPLRPKGVKAVDPTREKKIRLAKVRQQERQRAIDAGEIT